MGCTIILQTAEDPHPILTQGETVPDPGAQRLRRLYTPMRWSVGLWCFRALIATACFSMFMAVPWLRAPNTANLARPIAPYDVAEGKTLVLRPLGQLQERDVDFLARAIEARMGVSVEILTPQAAPAEAFDFNEGHYDANVMLDWLFVTRPERAWRYMGVTTDDLGTHDTRHVYGLANLREGVGIISLRHFQSGLRHDDPMARAEAEDQVARVTFHELTHTLGMNHCHREGCLMGGITDKSQINPDTPACERCVHNIQASLRPPRLPWLEDLVRGDGFYRRGLYGHALRLYELARRGAPVKLKPRQFALMENRVGAALISLEHIAEAERHIHLALSLKPDYPPAHYNQALIHAYAGDEASALLTLERAMNIEKDPISRHEYEARFFLEALEDPGSAWLALNRYKDAGGEDTELLAALDRLNAMNLVVFQTHEVDIIEAPLKR